MRILIVEDNAVNREFLRGCLEICGACDLDHGVCDAAETGEEAFLLFQEAWSRGAPYELIFMDVILPGMDGLQTLEKIRAREDAMGVAEEAKAKVIVASALEDDGTAGRAFFAGQAISYITKPLTIEKILGELNKFGLTCTP